MGIVNDGATLKVSTQATTSEQVQGLDLIGLDFPHGGWSLPIEPAPAGTCPG